MIEREVGRKPAVHSAARSPVLHDFSFAFVCARSGGFVFEKGEI
jgi:hypothetical protein